MSYSLQLQFLLSELLAQHPKATDEQLLELYCARVKEVPALLDLVLGCSFDETLAHMRELVLEEAEAEAWWAADRGMAALKARLLGN